MGCYYHLKTCSILDGYVNIEEHETFKGHTDSQRVLDQSQIFELLKRKKIYAKLPLSWKKSIDSAFVLPMKARYCTECEISSKCDACDQKTNQIEEFEENPNELKRQPINKNGQMLPWCFGDLDKNLKRFFNVNS